MFITKISQVNGLNQQKNKQFAADHMRAINSGEIVEFDNVIWRRIDWVERKALSLITKNFPCKNKGQVVRICALL